MRNEITEPHHWRSHTPRKAKSIPGTQHSVLGTQDQNATSTTRPAMLPAELVDAAFSDEGVDDRRQVLQSISTQLATLEAQRERLQRLLAEVQDD